MNDHDRTFLSKAGTPSGSRSPSAHSGLPPVLLTLAVRRVQILAVIVLVVMLVGWFLGNVAQGEFLAEFERVGEWGPATFLIGASLAMIGLARSGRVRAEQVVTAALAYEVAISFGIAFAAYFDTFADVPLQLMETDVVGYQFVAVWMLAFTVLVPAEPRRALVALVLSAVAIPFVYVLEVRAGRAPYLDPGHLWLVFGGPYALVAGLAYVSARVIYRLGQDVTRAREMGSYRLVEKLGQGGMGEVWRARHRMLARPAAVKLIHAESLVGAGSVGEHIARFEREAQATAMLQSPHTVEVYDFGTTDDGAFYYVMELLEGIDLRDLVRRFGPVPPGRAVHILRQVCASLAEAHRRGMVHRDVKPANIYLCQRVLAHDFVKVLDFGLVKHRDAGDDRHDLQLSRTGIIHGTPSFLAPEIARGDEGVDGRADLYAVGCVAYWLLTGRLVFERDSYPAMLLAHATLMPEAPSAHAPAPIPPALDTLVMACLVKEPADRLQTAEELMARLDAVPVDEPWTPVLAEAWWRANLPDTAPPPTVG